MTDTSTIEQTWGWVTIASDMHFWGQVSKSCGGPEHWRARLILKHKPPRLYEDRFFETREEALQALAAHIAKFPRSE